MRKHGGFDTGYCEELIDVAFESLSSREAKLTLKVSNCLKITIAGIRMLLDKCDSLEYLYLRSCLQITMASCCEVGLQFLNCCSMKFTRSLSEPDVLPLTPCHHVH
ncbi:hypothetical protein FEM48_Zijuj01G0192900 [Ziziphus jujuba var. spinosa]|uniref:Uncharacterized protein n=1 Tax=Ziziphus jujuba var. spinosa TaxID=714518 RepID=A0A978W331_ZIZJJ|nr:hypothetical protein FEM48_Zijuj01G0192000 [Ziziphus jujuba var. spinosa]KAH7546365.1 hypothetical protein FEM48_Zijuj01G0192900 [Ziziphus jujuba var. spinosa]